jgi:hypothetical protein
MTVHDEGVYDSHSSSSILKVIQSQSLVLLQDLTKGRKIFYMSLMGKLCGNPPHER